MTRLIRPYDLILDAASGWQALEKLGTSTENGRIELQTQQRLRPPLADANGTFGGHTLPRGVAIWGDEIFIADTTHHRILHWRPCCGPVRPLSTIGGLGDGPRQLDTPLGLTISRRDDLVVVDGENRRLLLFTLPGLALRRTIGPFSTPSAEGAEEPVVWRPVDAACGPDGTLYVLDANGWLWRCDGQGRPLARYPRPLPDDGLPRRLLVDDEQRLYLVVDLNAEERTVWLLDRYAHLIQAIDELETVLDAASGETLRQRLPASRLILDGERVLLAPADRRQCQRQPQPTDLRLDETGHLLLAGETAGPYLLHRPPPATYEPNGVYRFQPLDSERVGNPWHRVVLELSIPERTGVRLFSATSDVPRPDLQVAAPPAVDLTAEPPRLGPWQAAPDNADEWLIQSQPGRYLYLALVLKGPGDRTPAIDRLYVYAERRSSLHYLPAVYQADETSRHLLDRLLSLFDTVFGEVESEIEDFLRYLDIDGAPADFLPWLASWFDLPLLQSWSEAQRRQILENVVTLYRWRGTVRGLRRLLQLHARLSEPMPQIVEHFRGTGTPSLETWLGQSASGDVPHHFTVLLPAYTIDTPEKRFLVERLIDANKPAHTHYTLRPLHPGTRLGSDTIRGAALGLDSLLGNTPVWRLPTDTERESVLGVQTVLPAPPMPRAVPVRLGQTRLGAPRLGCRTCPPCEEN